MCDLPMHESVVSRDLLTDLLAGGAALQFMRTDAGIGVYVLSHPMLSSAIAHPTIAGLYEMLQEIR